jgi:hypothetical protein
VGFFFTNGVGGVNGAEATATTLPRGRICGVAASAGAATAFLARGFLVVVGVVMPHHGREVPEKQANCEEWSRAQHNNPQVNHNLRAEMQTSKRVVATVFLSLATPAAADVVAK